MIFKSCPCPECLKCCCGRVAALRSNWYDCVNRADAGSCTCGVIEGAPFQKDEVVKIVGCCDETGYPEMVGRGGPVVHLDYDCGCGQSYPDNPMIGVRLEPGVVFELWAEELEGP